MASRRRSPLCLSDSGLGFDRIPQWPSLGDALAYVPVRAVEGRSILGDKPHGNAVQGPIQSALPGAEEETG